MPSQSSRPIRDRRLWWFAKLDSAIDRADRQAITKAIKNLERLGVEVRFTLPLDGAVNGGPEAPPTVTGHVIGMA